MGSVENPQKLENKLADINGYRMLQTNLSRQARGIPYLRIRADHANLESGDGNEPCAGGAAGRSCPGAGAGRRGIGGRARAKPGTPWLRREGGCWSGGGGGRRGAGTGAAVEGTAPRRKKKRQQIRLARCSGQDLITSDAHGLAGSHEPPVACALTKGIPLAAAAALPVSSSSGSPPDPPAPLFPRLTNPPSRCTHLLPRPLPGAPPPGSSSARALLSSPVRPLHSGAGNGTPAPGSCHHRLASARLPLQLVDTTSQAILVPELVRSIPSSSPCTYRLSPSSEATGMPPFLAPHRRRPHPRPPQVPVAMDDLLVTRPLPKAPQPRQVPSRRAVALVFPRHGVPCNHPAPLTASPRPLALHPLFPSRERTPRPR
ncbi:vegetative cell wall protein gp1-like [Triticum dicoccoides]|uniref:vegetative cell wall protein gp1-like n=1 Tax=Triticum dicoccoides TaxID=85692 RepID=UPI00188E8207|nr:vegetative cell wall protein gp1-like [Triticum dicoccoides]